jgi:SAM-dependent methyltransferase
MTALIDTLFQLEKYLGLETDSLMPLAELDDIGGYHPDEALRKWWTGAIWAVEGQTLYALIRALKPETIVEIGSGTGCSSTHMAAALKVNGGGHITTVDRGNTPQIPADLQSFVTILPGDGINYLALEPDNSIDLILEDADHTADMCAAIGELAKTKLKPGGVLMAHDAAHWAVGKDVKAGYDLAGLDFRVYLTDPSDCGWLVWKRPTAQFIEGELARLSQEVHSELFADAIRSIGMQTDASPVIDTAVLQAQEEPNAKPVKRTRKPKAKK